ncbi:MAG: ABC-type transport auxiliary lipoprotein family protein [Burkholderiales bacterium]
MRASARLAALALAALLAACGGAPSVPVGVYDLGPPAAAPATKINAVILVPTVVAPLWLDSTAIVFRLNYQDVARTRTYAQSRWAGAPAEMLGNQLRYRLAQVANGGVIGATDGARADYALRLELEDFSQAFDAADASRGVVKVRATLIDLTSRNVLAQRSFVVERPAPTANADGAVRALGQVSGVLVEQVVAWTAASIPPRAK